MDALQISTPLHPHFEILRRWHAVADHQEILRRRRNGVNQSLFHRSPWFITLGHVNYVVHVKSFSELHHWIMPRKSLVAFRISPHPLPIHFLSPRSTTFTKFYHIPEVTPLMSGQVQLLKKNHAIFGASYHVPQVAPLMFDLVQLLGNNAILT